MTPRCNDDARTRLEVLSPILYNTYKHHAVALRRLDEAAAAGEVRCRTCCRAWPCWAAG